MYFTFRTPFTVDIVLAAMGYVGNLAATSEVVQSGPDIRLVYQDDTLLPDLTLWVAAALTCGLIKRPEIERM